MIGGQTDIPLAPAPDLDSLRRTLLRKGEPARVHHFEHGIAPNVQEALRQRHGLSDTPTADEHTVEQWDREGAVYRGLGFAIFRVWLPGGEFAVAGSKGITWGQEHEGPIQSMADLEAYDWPDPRAIHTDQLEHYEKHLPDQMGVFHIVKVWEVVRELIGFESFCFKNVEESALVEELTRRVGAFHIELVKILCQFDRVFAIYGADDYGFKTSTMLAPQTIRELFLPWHVEMARIAHEHGKRYFFHSCGKVDSLMDDLIDVVGADAKHSFEDTVVPVTEAKRRWGDRIAVLGGLDVDFVARSQPDAIRQRVRETLDVCQPGGGYCLGLGNWVTEYIPIENYEAVLDASRQYPLEKHPGCTTHKSANQY